MPGLLISNSIMSYFLVTGSVTLVIALICYPLFWAILWSLMPFIVPILVSNAVNSLIDGYITDYIYERLYCKRRDLAGFLDLAHFFLAIFEGFGAALMRFFKS
jgi:hypothetical protein